MSIFYSQAGKQQNTLNSRKENPLMNPISIQFQQKLHSIQSYQQHFNAEHYSLTELYFQKYCV